MAARRPSQSASTPPPPASVAEKLDMAELKNMIQSLTEEMKAGRESLKEDVKSSRESASKEFSVIKKDMGKILHNLSQVNEEIKGMKEVIDKNQQRIQKAEEKIQFHEVQIQDILLDGRRYEKSAIVLESDRAEFYLRFQNVLEEKGENTFDIIVEILAELMEEDRGKIAQDIDEVYRISTRFAARNNLPREIHVRFTKKSRRTQILQKSRIASFKYKEKDITVLKQVPRKVRDLRKDYQFLTSKLHQRGVNFRWLIPEGIFLTWQGQRFRLDSVSKAEMFYHQKFEAQEEKAPEKPAIASYTLPLQVLSEEYLLAEASGAVPLDPLTQQSWSQMEEAVLEAPKGQRQGVVTRAAKEKEKQALK